LPELYSSRFSVSEKQKEDLMTRKLFTIAVAVLSLLSQESAAQEANNKSRSTDLRPSDIFQFTNVWTIHLTFTAEQWEAMEPKQGGRPQFGGGRRGSFLQGPEGGRNVDPTLPWIFTSE
jgi:hypothetical protein